MAVDPATQFQQAGLNIPYSYTPVETKLNPPIQLPETGALWAKVGQTALEAASQIQKSPLNPAVREQMKYAVDQYKLGQEHNAFMRKLGPMGQMLVGTGPEGAVSTAPGQITDPTMAALFREAVKLGPSPGGDGDGGKPPPVNNPAFKPKEDQPSPDGAPPGGPPPGTFFNPATGSFEKLQQQPSEKSPTPPATKKEPPTTKQSGTAQVIQPTNMFASNAQTPAPSAPLDISQVPSMVRATNQNGAVNPALFAGGDTSQMVNQGAQQNAQGQQTMPTPVGDQLMSQWQNQNAHPVAPASEAKKWAQNNFDTRVTDATYMPHGGPLNQPAYAFHMKGGGTNLVPLSQMVQNGFAPNVAGNNTSMTLSAADQVRQQGDQQMQPTGAVGGQAPALQQGQGTQPVAQMQPTGNVGQPQPPAAPGMRDIYGNPISAYTSIPSKGGPSPTQLTADTESAGTRATVQPRPLWETVAQGDQDSVQAKAKDMGDQSGEYNGDRVVGGVTGPYTYYRDDDPNSTSRGRVYTVLPGRAGEYFNQQRWYLGSTNYESYELPDSMLRKNVADYWIPYGEGPSRQEIAHMGPAELKQWARQAWINQNTTKGPADEGTNLTLDTAEQLKQSVAKIKDMQLTLAANGIDLNSAMKFGAKLKNAAVGLGIGPIDPAMDKYTAATIRKLDEEVDRANKLAQDPKLRIQPGEAEGVQLPDLKVFGSDIVMPGAPGSNVISDSVFSGQPLTTRLRDLDAFQKTVDARYKSLIGTAQDNWQRVDPKHVRNTVAIDKGQDVGDASNLYKNHEYPGMGPMVSAEDYPAFAKAHPDTVFMTTKHVPMRTPK